MSTPKEAERCIKEFSGTELKGKKITVELVSHVILMFGHVTTSAPPPSSQNLSHLLTSQLLPRQTQTQSLKVGVINQEVGVVLVAIKSSRQVAPRSQS